MIQFLTSHVSQIGNSDITTSFSFHLIVSLAVLLHDQTELLANHLPFSSGTLSLTAVFLEYSQLFGTSISQS